MVILEEIIRKIENVSKVALETPPSFFFGTSKMENFDFGLVSQFPTKFREMK